MQTLLKTGKASEAEFWNALLFEVLLITAIVILLACVGQSQEMTSNVEQQKQAAIARKHKAVVSIPDRKLILLEDGKVRKVYVVAIGAPSTPTPSGHFRVVSRVSSPTYYHAGKVIAPGPSNPVGTRWIGLSTKGYGIHGTNVPKSIGKAASHGCVRMSKSDLEELFEILSVGDEVEIDGDRDPQLAALLDSNSPALAGSTGATSSNGL